jgi:hypothetical protein
MRVKVAACLCFKNSATYLAEWLAYYRAAGVEKFYLYDNESSDNYDPIVRPYVKRKLASLIKWPGSAQQTAMYEHCLNVAQSEAEWVAFMDDDEFVWPVVDANLPALMERFSAHAGVAACWYLFGSSKHEVRPPGLVIENYTWRTHPPLSSHLKCIVNPKRVTKPRYIGHSFFCEPGYAVVDEKMRPIETAETSTHSGDLVRVNHYATKSLQELRERRARPRADNGKVTEHPLSLWEYWADNWNQVEDRGILRFLPAVKANLEEIYRPPTSRWFFPWRK